MDPNANLQQQATLVEHLRTVRRGPGTRARKRELLDLRIALREWLARGGFAPEWGTYPAASSAYRRWVHCDADPVPDVEAFAAAHADLHRVKSH